MKLASTLTSVLAVAMTVAGQASHIRYPTTGTPARKGQPLTVQLVRPNSIMGSIEVGLAISFQYCGASGCRPPTEAVGTVLYHGPYNPEFHEIPGNPYQNFTVTIPDYDFLSPGPAKIITTRFHLIGAGPSPVLETNAVDVQYQ